MIDGVITCQSGARQFDGTNITKYSLFVGGVNATNNALRQYTPLVNGYCRLFMVRPPYALLNIFANGNPAYYYSPQSLFMQFKHMMEYMCRSVSGIGGKTLEQTSTNLQGGFAGRSFNLPTYTKEATQEVTVSLYELAGCPVTTVIDTWMNAIGDENSGLATYGGYISGGRDALKNEIPLMRYQGSNAVGIPFNEANHTCELIYVLHDRSGAQVEKAVLLADVYPKSLPRNTMMDMGAGGTHDAVTFDLQFNAIAYESPIITSIANDLLKQYRIVSNHLNFNPELGDAVYGADGSTATFNKALGEVPYDNIVGTSYGNLPVYNPTNEPKVTYVGVPSDTPAGTSLGSITAQTVTNAKLTGSKGFEQKPYAIYDQSFTDPVYRNGNGTIMNNAGTDVPPSQQINI